MTVGQVGPVLVTKFLLPWVSAGSAAGHIASDVGLGSQAQEPC